MYDNPDYVEEWNIMISAVGIENTDLVDNILTRGELSLRDRHPVTGEELDLIN